MAVDPDPRAHVASNEDFYALLSLPVTDFSAEELRRAYRKSSRIYHPDKAVKPGASEAEKEAARERWDLFEVAHKVLADPDLRAQYDNARTARQAKAKRHAELDATRRRFVEDLERREREAAVGAKREADKADEDTREKERLYRDFERRRDALAERRKAEMKAAGLGDEDEDLREDESAERSAAEAVPQIVRQSQQPAPSSSENHTVRLRFPESLSAEVTAPRLEVIFSQFGAVDAVLLGKVKKQRLRPEDRHRRPVGSCYISFKEQQSALEALARWKSTVRDDASLHDWARELEISWMGKDKEPVVDTRHKEEYNFDIPMTSGTNLLREAREQGSYGQDHRRSKDGTAHENSMLTSYRAGPISSDSLDARRPKNLSKLDQQALNSRMADAFAKAGGSLGNFEEYVLAQMKSAAGETAA